MTSFEQANEEKKLSLEEPFTIQIHYKSPNLNRDQGNVSLSQPKCLICYNQFPANELFSSLKCNHMVCKQCCKAYIESKMESFQVLDIECPQEGCTETISDNDIKDLLDTNSYNRYQKLLLLKTIQKNSISHVCPRPGCARPIKLKDNDKNKYITCKCGTQICKECFNLHHPSKSCMQSLDPDFESYIQQNDIRYCPMCKTPVIRVGGCSNMICCVCDYEWCWACGKHRGPEHVCTGSWDPVPSDIYRSWLQVLGSKLRAFGSGLLEVIAIPFQLLYNAIFWPLFFTARATAERRDLPIPEESTSRIVCQYVICGTVGLVLLPVTLVVGTVAVICNLPQLVREIRQEYFPPRVAEPPRRWEAGHANIFGYTATARPEAEIQPEPQAPAQESQEERSNKKNC